MPDNFDHLDDLPKRDSNHVMEEKAEVAFRKRLEESGRFILQTADRKDYGTDCQIEVVESGQATNIRIHVQLKGTERTLNVDESLSIIVRRENLNYLLIHEYSFYVAYHVPTARLFICAVEKVLRDCERAGKNWIQQKSLTVNFTEDLTVERFKRLANLSISKARAARNRRVQQSQTPPEDLPVLLRQSAREIHVPDEPEQAKSLLKSLYEKGAEREISAAFESFKAILGPSAEAMGLAYMSEINLGMARRSQFPKRIEEALEFFTHKLGDENYYQAELYYLIGNAFSALEREEKARENFEAAQLDPSFADTPGLASQCHLNLGMSYLRLGHEERAVEHYQKAVSFSPDLPEAHFALAQYYMRREEWSSAIKHLDQVVLTDVSLIEMASVSGNRANALFNNGNGTAAFREINAILAKADFEPWIWPYAARLVASFGRTNTENARLASGFWRRFINAHPEVSSGRRELLLTNLYLRSQGQDIGLTYSEFRDEFEVQIVSIDDPEDTAFLWDRLGHWAQDEDDWQEAERCFRMAYELAGGHYGYCLGTALNHLDRFDESLPLLREQAENLQPDAMSWFQLGFAYCSLGQSDDAIKSYKKALELDPKYDLAMFNLGGTYWNRGDVTEAFDVWKEAVELFPDHHLTAKLRDDMASHFPL